MSDRLWDEIQDEIEMGPEAYQEARRVLRQKGQIIGWLYDLGIDMMIGADVASRICARGEEGGGYGDWRDVDGSFRDRYLYYRDYIIRPVHVVKKESGEEVHWEAVHTDYDGAPYETDGPPADNRFIPQEKLSDLLDQIDELENENE